jgi:hypothetical protein
MQIGSHSREHAAALQLKTEKFMPANSTQNVTEVIIHVSR